MTPYSFWMHDSNSFHRFFFRFQLVKLFTYIFLETVQYVLRKICKNRLHLIYSASGLERIFRNHEANVDIRSIYRRTEVIFHWMVSLNRSWINSMMVTLLLIVILLYQFMFQFNYQINREKLAFATVYLKKKFCF